MPPTLTRASLHLPTLLCAHPRSVRFLSAAFPRHCQAVRAQLLKFPLVFPLIPDTFLHLSPHSLTPPLWTSDFGAQ
ncbi:hypothetical protein EDB84DRAFT_1583967 [Lactarius hengduanensis]|nr:hypothetical protein EDB84DRAFT_1583967 [Lactarius hengduanensis]